MNTHGKESDLPDDKRKERPTIYELFLDGKVIDEALRRGVQHALRQHKQLGFPVVVCRDGKVIEIPPEDIPA